MNKISSKYQKLKWYMGGKKIPVPHAIKHEMLVHYATRYKLKTFVETGTHSGGTVAAMRGYFEKIISIELSEEFYQKARLWLGADPTILLIHGDSGTELGKVVGQLSDAALFWLDGHYSAGNTAMGSKETPILEELGHIFNDTNHNHVVIIDDARLFGANHAYPTIETVKNLVFSFRENYQFKLKNDALIFTPECLES